MDRSLRDILCHVDPKNTYKCFGGKVKPLNVESRQILPIIPKDRREDIVQASINISYLWNHYHVFKLQTNVRLINGEASIMNAREIQ